MESLKPIFLLSLPRSGSTLFQRLLATDSKIATTSEPWILLPLVYARRPQGTHTEYSHWRSIIAHEDFARSLPEGEKTYREELAAYVMQLYRKCATPGSRYFLDKTPRYTLIAHELIELFPDAKFIILWRNPLAIAASMMQTWAGGRWNLDDYRVDFYDGLSSLLQLTLNHTPCIHQVRYEDLLGDSNNQLAQVFDFLELPFDETLSERFASTRLPGRFGDQTGVHRYDTVSTEPLEKWKMVMANPIRRAWAKRYLKWIGQKNLATMGYESEHLIAELQSIPRSYRFLWSDSVRRVHGQLNAMFECDMLRMKRKYRRFSTHVAHS